VVRRYVARQSVYAKAFADLLPLTFDAAIARAVNEPITPTDEARTEATHQASRREREALDRSRD
jgi:hypothetical protein